MPAEHQPLEQGDSSSRFSRTRLAAAYTGMALSLLSLVGGDAKSRNGETHQKNPWALKARADIKRSLNDLVAFNNKGRGEADLEALEGRFQGSTDPEGALNATTDTHPLAIEQPHIDIIKADKKEAIARIIDGKEGTSYIFYANLDWGNLSTQADPDYPTLPGIYVLERIVKEEKGTKIDPNFPHPRTTPVE